MDRRATALTVLMCLALAVCILAMVEDAQAQTKMPGPDEPEPSKLPGKLEMFLALGSVVAMIAAIKML